MLVPEYSTVAMMALIKVVCRDGPEAMIWPKCSQVGIGRLNAVDPLV
jgi:hypothetical protein